MLTFHVHKCTIVLRQFFFSQSLEIFLLFLISTSSMSLHSFYTATNSSFGCLHFLLFFFYLFRNKIFSFVSYDGGKNMTDKNSTLASGECISDTASDLMPACLLIFLAIPTFDFVLLEFDWHLTFCFPLRGK